MFRPEMFAKPEYDTVEDGSPEAWKVTLTNFGKGLVWVAWITVGLVAACFYFIWIVIASTFKIGNS
jgi:hypothetical protein